MIKRPITKKKSNTGIGKRSSCQDNVVVCEIPVGSKLASSFLAEESTLAQILEVSLANLQQKTAGETQTCWTSG